MIGVGLANLSSFVAQRPILPRWVWGCIKRRPSCIKRYSRRGLLQRKGWLINKNKNDNDGGQIGKQIIKKEKCQPFISCCPWIHSVIAPTSPSTSKFWFNAKDVKTKVFPLLPLHSSFFFFTISFFCVGPNFRLGPRADPGHFSNIWRACIPKLISKR